MRDPLKAAVQNRRIGRFACRVSLARRVPELMRTENRANLSVQSRLGSLIGIFVGQPVSACMYIFVYGRETVKKAEFVFVVVVCLCSAINTILFSDFPHVPGERL